MRHSAYIIDRPGFSFGYDLGSWALPICVALGRCNLHVQVLCFDVDVYWGEAAEQ